MPPVLTAIITFLLVLFFLEVFKFLLSLWPYAVALFCAGLAFNLEKFYPDLARLLEFLPPMNAQGIPKEGYILAILAISIAGGFAALPAIAVRSVTSSD